jgi:hypothetical protein
MVVVAPLAEDIFTKVFVSLCGGMRKFTKNKKFKLNVKEQLSHSLSLSLALFFFYYYTAEAHFK